MRRAVTGSVSIAGALRQLGLPDNSSARRLFRSWVQAEGVDTSHFLGQAHLRGQLRPTVTRPETVLIRHTGVRRTRTRVLRQALRDLGRPERCAECGTAPAWRGAPMTLEIDHIDGDWSNDQAQNLRFLCRNCHSTTATWCRGRGRATSR
ncbi:HNH endonuclease [Streptomyces sp. JJ36]|nr:HNH endonuclease [Streptomyces sp. JJ36]